MTKSRDITFDIMKGIGILLVITAHFFGWNHPVLGRTITSFHMPMFFMVAGYFSKSFSNWEEAKTGMRKYAKRLLPAYVFTQGAIVLWTAFLAWTKKEAWGSVIKESLSLLWADPYGPQTPWGNLTIGVVWFVVALFVSKLLLLFLSRLGGWSIPVSILLSFGAVLLHDVFPYSIWCLSLGVVALPFLTIGWWGRTHKFPIWLLIACMICWVLAILFSELDLFEFTWHCYPLDFLGACGGTAVLYFISRFLGQNMGSPAKGLAILGIWSLAIMCFHNLETSCHLGAHLMALFPFALPVWGQYVFRYFLTIAFAGVAVHTPGLKRLFV